MADEMDPMSSLAAKQAELEKMIADMQAKLEASQKQNIELMQTNAKIMQAQAAQPAPAQAQVKTEQERQAEIQALAFSSFKRSLNIKE